VSPIPQEFHEALGGQGDGNAAKVRKPTTPGTVISPRLRIRL